jgi:hypothetical protein
MLITFLLVSYAVADRVSVVEVVLLCAFVIALVPVFSTDAVEAFVGMAGKVTVAVPFDPKAVGPVAAVNSILTM